MAVDMFLKIDDIKGESKDRAFPETIEILSWSWGASHSGNRQTGGGGDGGKVSFQDISFSKWIDKSSPLLMKAVAFGEHINQATLSVRSRAGEEPFYKIILSDILVSSVSLGGGDGERPMDNLSLNFGKVEVEYRQIDGKGAIGEPVKFVWYGQDSSSGY